MNKENTKKQVKKTYTEILEENLKKHIQEELEKYNDTLDEKLEFSVLNSLHRMEGRLSDEIDDVQVTVEDNEKLFNKLFGDIYFELNQHELNENFLNSNTQKMVKKLMLINAIGLSIIAILQVISMLI